MSDWSIWCAAAGALVILEMLTGTYYLLMISSGLWIGGIAAMLGWPIPAQFVAAAVVSIAATMAHHTRAGKKIKTQPGQNKNVNLDIGETVRVAEWEIVDGVKVARVNYRGAMWDVELGKGDRAAPGIFTIYEIRGSKLIVQ